MQNVALKIVFVLISVQEFQSKVEQPDDGLQNFNTRKRAFFNFLDKNIRSGSEGGILDNTLLHALSSRSAWI